ncbi:hypothetical protein EPA99_15270 [Pseudoxanthomonas composti]|uniref:Uncharacterized protein n=1 Tax=Pseudoxanthomonas composti TaxID=2137479 RepID=A0A4Q1JSA5_9GAMM|nr:hypothetical protein EPA99_15270 [Pseudoxanthomonas composti]
MPRTVMAAGASLASLEPLAPQTTNHKPQTTNHKPPIPNPQSPIPNPQSPIPAELEPPAGAASAAKGSTGKAYSLLTPLPQVCALSSPLPRWRVIRDAAQSAGPHASKASDACLHDPGPRPSTAQSACPLPPMLHC